MTERFFSCDAIPPSPWKNGGGITREIATSPVETPCWRLSIADVTAEGPFSLFAGLERILTVIDGRGMVLAGADEDIHVVLHRPVRFAGSNAVIGRLPFGPIQNFNVMFDPTMLDADVHVSRGEDVLAVDDTVLTLIYCLDGAFQTDKPGGLRPHSGVIDPSGSMRATRDDATALCVRIRLKQT